MEFKLKRILPVLLGLIFLWAIFLTTRFVLEEKENQNSHYVPANSSMVLRIDGKHFLQTAAYDLAYKTKDNEIFEQLKILAARNPNRSEFRDAGIDFFSDVIFFSQPLEKTTIQGLIFNLSNSDKFSATMPEIVNTNQAFAAKGKIGILLTDNSETINQKQLAMHAAKLLSAESNSISNKNWKRNDGTFLNFELKNQIHAGIRSGSIEAKLKESLLEFSGTFQSSEKPVFSSKSLKPEGFHFSAAVLTQNIQNSLKNLLNAKGFDLPDIVRLSMNYRGTNIENGTMPLADLLLEFESEIDTNQMSKFAEGFKYLGFDVTSFASNGFLLQNGDLEYRLTILDEKTLFIGQHPENILNEKSDYLLRQNGDPSRITSIEGGGLLGMGINLYPPYKAGKDFFAAIASADIQMIPKNGKYVLNGKVQFKDEKYPVSESLKLIIGLMD